MRIAIAGATGHVGRPLAEGLAIRGNEVRVIARGETRLKSLRYGVKACVGSLDDEEFLKKALDGVKAAFVVIPTDLGAQDLRAYQRRLTLAWTAAIRATGVRRVVTLSSIGAQFSAGTGPIAGLHDLEQAMNALKHVHVLHLRPGYFMENLLMGMGLIKADGVYGSPLRADLAIPMIATRDIAAVALDILWTSRFVGNTVRELLGPRDYTLSEATRILGNAIGKSGLRYVELPYDQARQAMLNAGASPSVADSFIDMARAFNQGVVRPTETRSASNTTPTLLETFAGDVFFQAFAA